MEKWESKVSVSLREWDSLVGLQAAAPASTRAAGNLEPPPALTQWFFSQFTWVPIGVTHQRGCGFKTDNKVIPLAVILTAHHHPAVTRSWQDTHMILPNTTTLAEGLLAPFSRGTQIINSGLRDCVCPTWQSWEGAEQPLRPVRRLQGSHWKS